MTEFVKVGDHFLRKGWDQSWEYPQNGSLLALERFPSLAPFYFSWETNFNPIPIMSFTRRYYYLAALVTMLYILFIWIGPKMMQNRKAFDLRTPLRYWNLLLAAFSAMGLIRIVPHLFYLCYTAGLPSTICSPPIWTYGTGAAGLWTMLFIYSKFFELIDTVFIVLRKRPLSFLHWYHHATVLLYTWDAYVHEQPPGIYFCAMNYAVHAVMYSYYYLAAVMKKPPSWGAFVTVLQISQMVIGVGVTCVSLMYSYRFPFLFYSTAENALKPFEIPGCYVTRSNLFSCMAMYATYFYLFLDFFWNRYIAAPRRAKAAVVAGAGKGSNNSSSNSGSTTSLGVSEAVSETASDNSKKVR